MSKNISKYIAAFDCIDITLIVLSATNGGISIISFTSVKWSSCWNSKCKCYFNIFTNNRNNEETVKDHKK